MFKDKKRITIIIDEDLAFKNYREIFDKYDHKYGGFLEIEDMDGIFNNIDDAIDFLKSKKNKK